MTTIYKTLEFRNADNNATIYIQHYSDKPFMADFWRVVVLRDGQQLSRVVKDMLKNKPNKRQINNYIETI